MLFYLVILVSSVFLGSSLFAISLPIGQMSIYRIFSLMVLPIIIFTMVNRPKSFKINMNSTATLMVGVYVFWWIWAFVSVLWSISIGAWLQTMVLMTIGVSSVVGIFLWTRDYLQWRTLIKAVWVMLTFLSLWGLFEVLTGTYFLADVGKLDKYSTFATQPWTRMPITFFANQNDYATMLLAALPVNLILMNTTKHNLKKLLTLVCMILATLLIYQSGSRMSLLMAFAFFIIYPALKIRWDINRHWVQKGVIITLSVMVLAMVLLPSVRDTFMDYIYILPRPYLSGDTARVNMWRNGLTYFGRTLGLGVGAGNIEVWMETFGTLPTRSVFNIHNWWLEILVGYGVFVFAAYVLGYALMVYRLFDLRRFASKAQRQVMNAIITFLIIFIGASITSANNMLIEWHWVFFGLMIAYIGIMEKQMDKEKKRVR